MNTTTAHGRIGSTALRLFGILAIALLLTTALASHVSAEANNGPAMDKDAFKKGCESGGGSYIENNDGSFQCNLKSGGTIKCPDTTSQCTYTPMKTRGGRWVRPVAVGNLSLALDPNPTPVTNKTAVGASKAQSKIASAP